MTDFETEYDKLFIGGKWTEPSTSEVIEVHCPATGEYVGKVPLAAAADVDAAVAAARAAVPSAPWPTTPAEGARRRHRQRAQVARGAQGHVRQAARRRDRPAADHHRDDALDGVDGGDELLRRSRCRPGQVAGDPQRLLWADHR